MKIYIIEGNTGEYGDYQSWLVKAFHDRGKAEYLCKQLNDTLKRYKIHTDNCDKNWYDLSGEQIEYMESLDKLFRMDYIGVEYNIKELEIE